MKKKVLTVLVFILSLYFITNASADSYDFIKVSTTNKKEEVQNIINTQELLASTYSSSLNSNQTLKYTSEVTENTNTKEEEKYETSSSKDEVVSNWENQGYTVSIEELMHDAVVTEYTFDVENGNIITEGNYNGKSIDTVIEELEGLAKEDEDTKIVVTIDSTITNVNEEKDNISTKDEAEKLKEELESKGYTVTLVANNDKTATTQITSDVSLTNDVIKREIESENQGKEVTINSISTTNPTGIQNTAKYDTEEAAKNKKEELEQENRYETIDVNFEYTSNTTTVSTKNYVSSGTTKIEKSENVTGDTDATGNNISGYRKYESVLEDFDKSNYIETTTNYTNKNACEQAEKAYDNKEIYTTKCSPNANSQENNNNGPGNNNRPVNNRGYTLTVTQIAEYKIYYDEYAYAKKYYVTYEDKNYIYDITYLATDYKLSYTGTTSTYDVKIDNYDKYYVLNGSRTTYTITTMGNIITESIDNEVISNPYTIDNIKYYILLGLISMLSMISSIIYIKANI